MKDEVVINGIRVGPDTDVTSLIRRQLLDGSLLAGRYDNSPEQGVWSLYTAAKGTTIGPRIIAAVKTLLTDRDVSVRLSAVYLAQAFSDDFQASDLLAVLNSKPHLFVEVPGRTTGQDLSWVLMRAIAGARNWTPDVRDRIRFAALDPQNGLSVLAALVSRDPDWVIEHGPELIGDQSARAEVILFRMKDPVLRERLIRAIPRESPSVRKLVANAVTKEVTDANEKNRLLALLRTQ